MQYNANKMHQAILYFLGECSNHYLGRTKLMKLLYYLDFDHYERELVSVTGSRYRSLQFGPVPEEARVALNALENSGQIISKDTGTYHRFVPVTCPDLSVFSPAELETLNAVAARWRDATTDEIVEQTHAEAPWKLAPRYGDIVPYMYARLRRFERAQAEGDEPLSTAERSRIVEYIRTSQALEGIQMTSDEVEEALDLASQQSQLA